VTATLERYAPMHQTAPAWADTDGDLAANLAANLGWQLDPVQRWHVDANLAVNADGLPACPATCIVGPRQTVGKTVGLEVSALFDVFVADVELVVWTAHLYSTSEKTWLDMRRRIERNPDYARRCHFPEKNGGQAIVVDGERRIEFHARSGRGGRGFPGVRRLVLDEWLYGRPGDLGALAPTMVTQADAQVRYASSAGFVDSSELRRLRTRGRGGADGALAYLELGAQRRPCGADGALVPLTFAASRCRHELTDATCALNDRGLWWQANSGLWSGRVREADVATQRRELSAAEFAREFLSWWEDPPNEDGGALDVGAFASLAQPSAERVRPVAFGVAVAPDRSWSAIAVAWKQPGGFVHTRVVDYRPHATWLRDRISDLRRSWGGDVVLDTRARPLWPEEQLPAWLRDPSESDQAEAEATLSDRLDARTLTHGNSPELLTAVRAAAWRQAGAHRRLESSGTIDVSPLRAAALATHAASTTVDPLAQVW
jgi:hypothetical protein